MRKFWAIVVAVLMLGQWSYAAAGVYCTHEGERSAMAAHWGHHFHKHASHDQGSPDSKASFDGDCAFCHAGVAFSPMTVVGVMLGIRSERLNAAIPLRLASRSPDLPDRPQWRVPALA